MSKKKSGLFSIFRRGKSKEPSSQTTDDSQLTAVVSDSKMVEDSFSELNNIIPSTPLTFSTPTGVEILTHKGDTEEISLEVIKEKPKKKEQSNPTSPIRRAKSNKSKKTKTDGARKKKIKVAAPPPPPPTDFPHVERGVDVGETTEQLQMNLEVLSKQDDGLSQCDIIARDRTVFQKTVQTRHGSLIGDSQFAMYEIETARGRATSDLPNTPTMIQAGVIHYSPHGTIRSSSAFSPEPVSDLPHIERQSNFQLNDTANLKSIPVTCYDGRPKQKAPPPPPSQIASPLDTGSKKRQAPPPPVTPQSDRRKTSDILSMKETSTMTPASAPAPAPSTIIPIKALTTPPQKTPKQSVASPIVKESEQDSILVRKYEALEAKFSRWKALKSISGDTEEVKRLQAELYRDHDEVMAIVKASGMYSPDTMSMKTVRDKIRPTLNADTFQPRISTPLRSPLTIVANQQPPSNGPSSSSSPYSSPGTSSSRPVTPKSSSISPTASEDSADSGVVKCKPTNQTHSPQQKILDINSNMIRPVKTSVKPEDENQRAMDRVRMEAQEYKRREQELKKNNPSPSPQSSPPFKSHQRRSSEVPSPTLNSSSRQREVVSTSNIPSPSSKNISSARYHVYRSPQELRSPVMKSTATSPTPPPIPSTPAPQMTRWSSQIVVNTTQIERPSSRDSNRPEQYKYMGTSVTNIRLSEPPSPRMSKNIKAFGSNYKSSVDSPSPSYSYSERLELQKAGFITTSPLGTTIEIGRPALPHSGTPLPKTPSTPSIQSHYNPNKNNNNNDNNNNTNSITYINKSKAKILNNTATSSPPASPQLSERVASRIITRSDEEQKLMNRSKNVSPQKAPLSSPQAFRKESSGTEVRRPFIPTSTSPTSNMREIHKEIRRPLLDKPSPSLKISTEEVLPEIKAPPPPLEKQPIYKEEQEIIKRPYHLPNMNNRKTSNPHDKSTTLEHELIHDFPVLRSVGLPKEKNGIALGRVIDTPSSSTPSIPQAPPPPPPGIANGSIPPPPPPPPPPVKLLGVKSTPTPPVVKTPTVSSPTMAKQYTPPTISSQELQDQKGRLRKSAPVVKTDNGTPDIRDSLMDEIRKAGGIRSLKKTSA